MTFKFITENDIVINIINVRHCFEYTSINKSMFVRKKYKVIKLIKLSSP